MNRQFCFLSLLIIFSILFVGSSSRAEEKDPIEKATAFINYYNKKDFLGATKIFHYPPNYTAAELNEDKAAISKTLKMYYEEFGKIEHFEKSDMPPLYYFHMIGGGNLPYWQKYSDVYNVNLKVKFSREGEGYVTIVFCNILNKWEIRQVNYGLSADRIDAQTRLNSIKEKWQKMMGL